MKKFHQPVFFQPLFKTGKHVYRAGVIRSGDIRLFGELYIRAADAAEKVNDILVVYRAELTGRFLFDTV